MSAVGLAGLRSAVGALLLAASAFLLVPLYTGNPALGFAWETTSAGLAARSLARSGDLGVEEFFPLASPGDDITYALRWQGERLYSMEPVASIATFAPFFLGGPRTPPAPRRPEPFYNRVAAWVAASTAAVLLLWLRSVASLPRALVAVSVIALGTSHRSIAGAGLWTHSSGTLWLALGLFAWTRAPRHSGLYPVGALALALATACRPILAPTLGLLVVDAWLVTRLSRARAVRAVAATAVAAGVGALSLYANWFTHDSLLGGRAQFVGDPTHYHAVSHYFGFSPVHLAGLLVAPSRGLFVFSPVLLFAIPGLFECLRRGAPRAERLLSLGGVSAFLLYGFFTTWWAGSVYGPRYMTDLLPFFALWLARTPLPRRGRAAWAALFAAALLWSAGVQEVGARAYPCGWNSFPVEVDRAPARVWGWRDTQIRRCALRALHRAEAETRDG